MISAGTQIIQTARLTLRPFQTEDAAAVYKNYGSDPKVKEYIRFVPCATLEAAKGFIAMHLEQYKKNPSFYGWAITLDDTVIGSVGLFNVDEDQDQCELGYSLGSKWWGRGYGSEAAQTVLLYGFNQIKAHRIYASHHIDNMASGRVLEKIGMKPEGILRDGQKNADGTYSDLKLYARLITD